MLSHAVEIGVIAKDGVVTLIGEVDCYTKKIEAENLAKRVNGVKALIERIEVIFPNQWSKTDSEIAFEVLTALKINYSVPNDKITIKVENRWVTLEGELACKFQGEGVKSALGFLTGIKGVTNNIKIKSEKQDAIEKEDIEKEIAINCSIDGGNISVSVSGTTVTLTGNVSSWFQKEASGRIAWKSPGIWSVKNKLTVDFENFLS